MPTYLERIQDIYNKTPKARLQEYWARAESLSGGNEEKTEAIFNNMLSISEEAPSWWTSMSKKKKRHFMGKKQRPKQPEAPAKTQEKLISVHEPEKEPAAPTEDEEVPGADAPQEEEVPTSEEQVAEPTPAAAEPESTEEPAPAETDAVVPAEVADTPDSDTAPEESDDEPEPEDTVHESDDEPEPDDTAPEEVEDAEPENDGPEPDWWHKLSKQEKQDYLEEHPKSKFVLSPGDGEEDEPPPSWWLKLSTEDQKDYLKKNPENKLGLKVVEDDLVSIKSAISSAWHKRRAKSVAVFSQHKKGLHALKTLFSGGGLKREEREQAKKTAILGTKLVLGALVGIAVFAALGPSVAILAKLFLDDQGMSSESSADANDPNIDPTMDDAQFSGELLDKIKEWITTRDINDLKQRIEEEKQNAQPKSV